MAHMSSVNRAPCQNVPRGRERRALQRRQSKEEEKANRAAADERGETGAWGGGWLGPDDRETGPD